MVPKLRAIIELACLTALLLYGGAYFANLKKFDAYRPRFHVYDDQSQIAFLPITRLRLWLSDEGAEFVDQADYTKGVSCGPLGPVPIEPRYQDAQRSPGYNRRLVPK